VAEAENAASGAFTAARGDMTVTAPLVFGRLHVLPVITAFLRANPEIDIHLTLADRLLHLQDDHVDLAVRIGALPDSSLMAIKVGTVRRVVCASPAYLAAHGAPTTPDDLARHHCVSFTGLGQMDRWMFNTMGVDKAVAIRSRLTVNTAEAAIDAAIDGVGVTRVLSYQIANAEKAGLLVRLLQDHEPTPAPISLVFDGQGVMPQKLRALLDFATPRLKERLVSETAPVV
jgi:DNA-binding transcriptional LysR family regulator